MLSPFDLRLHNFLAQFHVYLTVPLCTPELRVTLGHRGPGVIWVWGEHQGLATISRERAERGGTSCRPSASFKRENYDYGEWRLSITFAIGLSVLKITDLSAFLTFFIYSFSLPLKMPGFKGIHGDNKE